jgi:hypothetical protein
MGGQACVLYGAAEFSRDLDLLIFVDADNLNRIRAGLADLLAEPIAVPVSEPPLSIEILSRGHAFHFRCHRPDVEGLRIDLMANLRGMPSFDELWQRRTTLEIEGETIDLMARKDLIVAKQTQRDKDWLMVARLVEVPYFTAGDSPSATEIDFLLRELRTPEILIEATARFPDAARRIAENRPALEAAMSGNRDAVSRALRDEQDEVARQDRLYWEPLKRELEQFRRERRT